jgi:sulfur carrier protein
MRVTVNEKPEDLPESATVAALLERHGLARSACAVEVNRLVGPRREHPTRVLREGDQIELVTLVGGG